MTDLPLPPDLDRLRTLRTYLAIQLSAVDAAIAELDPPDGWRLQPRRTPAGQPRRAVLHRGDCWIRDGKPLSRAEAKIALDDSEVVEACGACYPEKALGGEKPPDG